MCKLNNIQARSMLLLSITILLSVAINGQASATTATFNPATGIVDLYVVKDKASASFSNAKLRLTSDNNLELIGTAKPVPEITEQYNTYDVTTGSLNIPSIILGKDDFNVQLEKITPETAPIQFTATRFIKNNFEGCLGLDTTKTGDLAAGNIEVIHQNGQSFVSWRDRAEGEAGAVYRYDVYWSNKPIANDADLGSATQIGNQILNHSGQLFGNAWNAAKRIDPTLPMATLQEGAAPLPLWSGLWVVEPPMNGCAYYAVIATDVDGNPIESAEPGVNATIEPIVARTAPRQAIKVLDGADRPTFAAATQTTGTPGLPLNVSLHGSGGRESSWGDLYLYFADKSMGYKEGMPGIFTVTETHSGSQFLRLQPSDAILRPNGAKLETLWYGYLAEPPDGRGRFIYPFTTTRLSWMISWVIAEYNVDPERIYGSGGSMGASGTVYFSFRHPEIFAAVYPNRTHFRRRNLRTNFDNSKVSHNERFSDGELVGVMQSDGSILYNERLDTVRFINNHPEDLPFIGWNTGRNDSFNPWQDQIDMVAALTAGRHGFAFAWNDGNHSSGSSSHFEITKWYPQEKFARNLSYPAFSNSSINNNMGGGDPTDVAHGNAIGGDLIGGINLGFDWTNPIDAATEWMIDISNALATADMTVDITPRRVQNFHPIVGANLNYEVVRQGGVVIDSGMVSVDENGLITITSVSIFPNESTAIRLFK